MKKLVCESAFYNLEVDNSGNVYPCCPSYSNFRAIGNILSPDIKSIEEIFHSPKAIELRTKILNNDYSLCNTEFCRQKKLVEIEEEEALSTIPKYMNLAYDKECNLKCIYCRDEYIKNDEEKLKYYDEKILPKLIPLLTKIECLKINGIGEALASRHTRNLIKFVAKNNKKVVFDILTNGLLFNEANIDLLGLRNRLGEVGISIHSLNKKTYEIIMKGSHFDTVIKNIKNANKFSKNINLLPVLSDLNYMEIPDLVEFAKELGVNISFSVYLKWGAKIDKDYENYEVWNPNHKHYNDLKEILKITLDKHYPNVNFSPILLNMVKTKI